MGTPMTDTHARQEDGPAPHGHAFPPGVAGHWFDRPLVGTILAGAVIVLFALIVSMSGCREDTASARCAFEWPPSVQVGPLSTIDVPDRDIHVGDQLCVRIVHAGPATVGAPDAVRHWHLLLNGLELAQTAGPDAIPGRTLVLSFTLPAPTSASSNSAQAIAALWSDGISAIYVGRRFVSLRLRADASGPFPGYELLRQGPVVLHIFEPWVAICGIILLVLFASGLVWLARNTAMLRDGAGGGPSSLARTQMAFWFALTIAGFCYVWLLTGIWQHVFTPTTLALLGISSTTGLGAIAIATPKAGVRNSSGFLLDILSDQVQDGQPAGVEVHRVIMATWTVVLGGVFASSVLWTQRFPSFDPALLTLMGLISGLYVGFKWLGS